MGFQLFIVHLHYNNHIMAKIIKKAVAPKKTFTVGQWVSWDTYWNDGRVSQSDSHWGTVIKVCPVNLQVEDKDGNIWSVSKEEARK